MNLALVLELTLRGSLVLVPVQLADRFFARTTTARWRRIWWLLVPLAFLAPCSFPHPSLPVVVGFNGITNSTLAGETTPVRGEFDLYTGFQLPAGPQCEPPVTDGVSQEKIREIRGICGTLRTGVPPTSPSQSYQNFPLHSVHPVISSKILLVLTAASEL